MYGCLGSSFKLSRTVIVGKNRKLVKQILKFLTYFIRCCEITENFIRPEKQKTDSANRLSSSNWSDTLSLAGSQTNSSMQGWFERSCNIINTTDTVNPNLPVLDPFKDFQSYNHLESLSEQDECLVTPRTSDRNIISKLKSMNMNTTKCYCAFLQALNKINDKSLRSYVNMEDLKKQELQINSAGHSFGKAGISALKSCVLCKTLEKGMFDEFCDKCRLDLQKSSIEVVDTVCLHCANRLEDLKTKNLENEASETCACCNKDALDCVYSNINRSKLILNTTVCQKKPSFVCYCCTPSTYGNLDVMDSSLKIDTSQGSLSDIDLDITPRPRKSSDPIDVVPLNIKNTANSKFSNMRNSTNSHDSGTEMEGISVGSSTESYTRTNSLSSQNGIPTDIDSDYCSVENEQLASTLIENSTLLHLQPEQLLLQQKTTVEYNNIQQQEVVEQHNLVTKSFSTNTLKSSLDLVLPPRNDQDHFDDYENEDDIFTPKSTLDCDLERLKLQETNLPKTVPRVLHRKNSGR